MAEIIKIALLGIAGVLFAIQFRQQRPDAAAQQTAVLPIIAQQQKAKQKEAQQLIKKPLTFLTSMQLLPLQEEHP